jgi:prolyl-tRNA synthetase
MKQQHYLIRTLRDIPADAETASHQWMLRAGLIRQLSSGVYSYLPLGLRVLHKIQQIVREEMDHIGAQEVLMPALQPAELWQQSGRWDIYGSELMRLEDRHGRAFALGATHEEVITSLIKEEIHSYKKLPVLVYQIQTKFRDERRPRFGLLRGREFIMKDAYSFDHLQSGLDESYARMYQAYENIFTRCQLIYRPVMADSGAMGGNDTHEFMALADIGEDTIAHCPSCGYAANIEKAESLLDEPSASSESNLITSESISFKTEKIHTPGTTTISQLTKLLNVPAKKIIKAVALDVDGKAVVAYIRGDLEINEIKLKHALQASHMELLSEAIITQQLQSVPGFIGPVQQDGVTVVADHSVGSMVDAIAGANERDTHLLHVLPARDFLNISYYDLRTASEGDLCCTCRSPLAFTKGIEIGHIFKLGTKYSESFNSIFLDENGSSKPMIMGCYGIGISRMLAAIIEQHHDDKGIVWPVSIAPFAIHLLTMNMKDAQQVEVSEELYRSLVSSGYEVLWDNREERAGVKFNDADFIGIPVRITVGKKAAEQLLECKERHSDTITECSTTELLPYLEQIFKLEV